MRPWNPVIRSLLEKAAFDLDDEDSIIEICAHTRMSRRAVLDVLEGNESATVECVYRISAMLNVPAADLINPSNSVFTCYSIDGGRPRTLSLTDADTNLRMKLAGLPLLYAEDLDGSYPPLVLKACVIFVNNFEAPSAGNLYLLEGKSARYARRCVFVDVSKKQAHMTDDVGSPVKTSVLKYGKLSSLPGTGEMLLGRIICSICPH